MLRTLFVFAILIPGVIAAVFDRFAALLLYLWFALFRPQEWMWTDISSLRPSLVLGALLVVPCVLSGVFPNITHPLSIGSILFLLTGLVAQSNAVRPDIGWQWIDFLARLLVVSLLAVTLVNTKRRFVIALAVVAGSLGFHTAKAGVAFIFQSGVQFAEGLAGAFPDNEGYALATIMVLPLLLATGQNIEFRPVRWVFLAAVPLSVLTVVGTFSRGGFVGLIAAVLMFAVLQKQRVFALAGVMVAVLLLLVVAPIPSRYFDRIETIRTYREIGETSALSRFHFWRVAIRMAGDYPLGIGLNNYEYLYDAYDTTEGLYGRTRAVHNSFLEVLAEAGFAGAAIYLGLFAYALETCRRVRVRARAPTLSASDSRFLRTYANALIVSMVGFAAAGSFLALALNDLTWLTFAFVAALDRLSARMISEDAIGREVSVMNDKVSWSTQMGRG